MYMYSHQSHHKACMMYMSCSMYIYTYMQRECTLIRSTCCSGGQITPLEIQKLLYRGDWCPSNFFWLDFAYHVWKNPLLLEHFMRSTVHYIYIYTLHIVLHAIYMYMYIQMHIHAHLHVIMWILLMKGLHMPYNYCTLATRRGCR